MSTKPKILAFAGSARKDSFNVKLMRVAASIAEENGAEVTVVDFRDLEMPLYDGDIENANGLPESAKRFKKLMKEHHGFLIASPEYNSSISPLLKNAIDWASRPEEGEKPLEAFLGKTAGLLSASPGGLGGLRGLVTLRSILGNIQVLVLPQQFALSTAHEAFDEVGALRDAKQSERVAQVVVSLIETTRNLISR